MKTVFFQLLLAGLITSGLSGCANATSEADTSKPAGGNLSKDNEGNNATDPRNAPGTEYPGSAGDSVQTINDTIHVHH